MHLRTLSAHEWVLMPPNYSLLIGISPSCGQALNPSLCPPAQFPPSNLPPQGGFGAWQSNATTLQQAASHSLNPLICSVQHYRQPLCHCLAALKKHKLAEAFRNHPPAFQPSVDLATSPIVPELQYRSETPAVTARHARQHGRPDQIGRAAAHPGLAAISTGAQGASQTPLDTAGS